MLCVFFEEGRDDISVTFGRQTIGSDLGKYRFLNWDYNRLQLGVRSTMHILLLSWASHEIAYQPAPSNRFVDVPQPGLNFDHGWTTRRIHCPARSNDFPQLVAHLFRLAAPKGGIMSVSDNLQDTFAVRMHAGWKRRFSRVHLIRQVCQSLIAFGEGIPYCVDCSCK